MFFADLVDSTALSVQVDPETYRLVAVQAGVEIAREVSRLSNHLQRRFGFGVSLNFSRGFVGSGVLIRESACLAVQDRLV
jgi:class 3 adenylate cyclase